MITQGNQPQVRVSAHALYHLRYDNDLIAKLYPIRMGPTIGNPFDMKARHTAYMARGLADIFFYVRKRKDHNKFLILPTFSVKYWTPITIH